MARARWIAVGCALLGVGGIAAALSLELPESKVEQPRFEDPRIERLEGSVARIERVLLAQGVSRQGGAAEAPTEERKERHAEEGPKDVAELDEVEATEPAPTADQVRAEELTRFQARFADPAQLDRPWTRTKEQELRRTLTASSLGRVERIDCRGSICRVETSHASAEQAEAFLDENSWAPGLRETTYHRYSLDEKGNRFIMFVEERGQKPN